MKATLHYRPVKNWINDPNGLFQADGLYHLFYQYNPEDVVWGNIHWGHARSADLYHWEDLPVAMSPDIVQGEVHCFSGCCCCDEDGKPHFFYTSVGKAEDHRDARNGAEQWSALPADSACLKLVQDPSTALINSIHPDFRVRDWRDPCVVRHGSQYLMILGGCVNERGSILLYTSPDMRSWQFRHILLQSECADGIPWECPNLFFADEYAVLLWSPCSAVRYAVGHLDEDLRFVPQDQGVFDPAGHRGYYAPQVFSDEAGRHILMGWMPETDGEEADRAKGWSGVMAIPRLLSVSHGVLTAQPFPGWETLCEAPRPVTANVLISAASSFVLEADTDRPFTIQIRAEKPQHTLSLSFNGDEVLLSLPGFTASRRIPAQKKSTLFLCVDETTVEACMNGLWISGRFYPDGQELSLQTDLDSATLRRLKSPGPR